MASVILYCMHNACRAGYASIGELPVHCPACGLETKWATSPPHRRATDWNPTVNDRQFLKAVKIDPA